MISIVACCHSAKLCAHGAQAFPIITVYSRDYPPAVNMETNVFKK